MGYSNNNNVHCVSQYNSSSNIYDVWCKGSAHLGMKKMKIKAKKYQKNNNKDEKDKKN